MRSRTADADGLVIEDGVLKEYTGTTAEVGIPEGVTRIGRVRNKKIRNQDVYYLCLRETKGISDFYERE